MENTVKLMTRAGLAAITAAAGVAVATGVAAPAQAYPSGDPSATGCANGASTIWKNTYLGAGTVEVRYSPGCGTNWVRVSGATNRQSEAGIYSSYSGWQWSPSYSKSPSQYWTPMVYAPGSTCVTFRVKMQNGNGIGITDTGNKQLC
ncbi:hypothetical protein CYJ73_20990 [Gordonia terrae]|uniref:DUF2690 domain-containing protein n=2 Tax=Gordonia terrae TaxID=2055 RepID=A0A2I1R343_9ACTN|nr:hypothetical protein CYJ73_20990 [Gordonia terrae]